MKIKITKTPNNISDMFFRSLVIGLVYVICLKVFGQIFSAANAQSGFNDHSMVTISLLFTSGVIVALAMGSISVKLTIPSLPRYFALFFILYVVGFASNIIEYYFFSTATLTSILHGSTFMLSVHLVVAAAIFLFFQPTHVTKGLTTYLKEYFAQRGFNSWIWRFVLASLSYIVIYFFFGALVSPIVLPYYQDPSLGLELILPSFNVIIPLEFMRGLIYTLVLLPIIVVPKMQKRELIFWLGTVLTLVGAVAPLLSNEQWPIILRVVHGLEITADSFTFSYVLSKLLGKYFTN